MIEPYQRSKSAWSSFGRASISSITVIGNWCVNSGTRSSEPRSLAPLRDRRRLPLE